MNLTLHYVKYVFHQITRDEIVKYVDVYILGGLSVNDQVLDLSLSESVDEYEFTKRLMSFVEFPISDTMIKDVVYSGLMRIEGHDDKGFLHGLMIARNNWNLDEKYSELYYNLDHYIVDEPEYTPAERISMFIDEWINKYIKSAQQADAPEPASRAR